MKIRMCCRQITLLKIDEICPLAMPKQTSTISMHTPFGKNLLTFTRFHPKMIIGMNEQMYEGHTDGHMENQCDTTIPGYYHVVGYKSI